MGVSLLSDLSDVMQRDPEPDPSAWVLFVAFISLFFLIFYLAVVRSL